MRRFIASCFLAIGLLFGVAAVPATALAAYNPFQNDCSGAASASAVCSNKNNSNPISGKDGILLKATRIVAVIAGVAAVIMIIIGAIKYVTSGGDSSAAGSAKNTIIFALIGLVVIVLAQAIITFVVSQV